MPSLRTVFGGRPKYQPIFADGPALGIYIDEHLPRTSSIAKSGASASSASLPSGPSLVPPSVVPVLPASQNDPSTSKHTHTSPTESRQEIYYSADPMSVHSESSGKRIIHLEKIVKRLQNERSELQRTSGEQVKTIKSLRSEVSRREIDAGRLEGIIQRLHDQLATSQRTASQERDSVNETTNPLLTNLRAHDESENLQRARQDLLAELAKCQQKIESLTQINHAHDRLHQCESMFSQGRARDAGHTLSEMMRTMSQDVRTDELVRRWLPNLADRCSETLERIGDDALSAGKHDEAVEAYSTLLSIGHSIGTTILQKWASTVLSCGSTQEALSAAMKFDHPMSAVYRAICDTLERSDRLSEAIECFRLMRSESNDETTHNDGAEWEKDFQERCILKLEELGDVARDLEKHREAVGHYSDILLLDSTNFDVLLKHSNEVIAVDPSSYEGYKGKHAALHDLCLYREAVEAFQIMLLKLEQSPDPDICKLRSQYVDATSVIQLEVNKATRDMPSVLIDTETGRLYDKAHQGEAFKELPIYDELRSSMTTQVDLPRIQTEVKKFYRYVMFSHRWQPHEPTFQEVENASVYKLPLSPKFTKLQNFCKLVCALQFKWAWTDTCCVNQLDKGVQQESVVAMFKWYRGSALTIVHLTGVLSASREMDRLRKSIWNTRGWTYQEYVASQVVQFYTEDWKPYLELQIFNHKESPHILSEMEHAMNFTANQLTTIRPGLDRVREKLYLASTRQTTREEDIAYSLFGIFNVALPVIYGEGLQAVGRLLEHVLTRSGDVTILAWTGTSGSHHSYLPVDLTVYDQITPPHIPPSFDPDEMDGMVAALHLSSLDPSSTTALYNQLHNLPSLSLVAGRLRLPGITFPLNGIELLSEADVEVDIHVYRGTTPMLGEVEIKTKDDLSETEGLVLVHPWISPLLDRDFSRGIARCDLATRAVRLVVRLRQSFGALLLAPSARSQYRRVATDSFIMVRVREEVSLEELMDSVQTVDIQ